MIWVLVCLVILLGIVLSAFFSGAETGIYCLSRPRLHLGARQLHPHALRLAHLLEDEPGALTTTLIGTNLMNYLATTAAAYMFADLVGLTEIDTELYTVILMTPIVFVFGEVVPKNLFQRHADSFMMRGSGLLVLADRLFRMTGSVWCLAQLSAFVARVATGKDPGRQRTVAPRRRVAMLLQEALADHKLGEDQSELIDRVFQLSETALHEAMVPRNLVTAIQARTDHRELIRVARRTGHARLPVYDVHPRRIVGLVDIDDLLQTKDWKTVADRLEPALTLSPHDTVGSAIVRMQTNGRQMAIVTDRGGQMLGIVTIRDILEEVVGELAADV